MKIGHSADVILNHKKCFQVLDFATLAVAHKAAYKAEDCFCVKTIEENLLRWWVFIVDCTDLLGKTNDNNHLV